MTADVYAADDAAPGGSITGSFRYVVLADADPDVLSRIANQFNIANRAPWRLELTQAEGCVTVVIEQQGISVDVAASIHRKIAQLTCVVDVDVTRVDSSLNSAAKSP